MNETTKGQAAAADVAALLRARNQAVAAGVHSHDGGKTWGVD
jgi:hypothetical protein